MPSIRADNHLSRRQREVVQLVARGMLNKEIAYELHLTYATVKEYLFRIFRKVGVSNRTELVVWGYEHGVLSVHPPAKVITIAPEGVAKTG